MNNTWRIAIIAELQRVYSFFSRRFFVGKLVVPQIVFDWSRPCVFQYVPETNSLMVGAGFRNCNADEILVALLHEEVHHYNHLLGRVDHKGNYHKKSFVGLATEVGLIVLKHKTQGFSLTTTIPPRNTISKTSIRMPTKKAAMRRAIIFQEARLDILICSLAQKLFVKQPRKKTYFFKWVCKCPPPHNSIRSGRKANGPHALRIVCQDCGSPFVCEC